MIGVYFFCRECFRGTTKDFSKIGLSHEKHPSSNWAGVYLGIPSRNGTIKHASALFRLVLYSSRDQAPVGLFFSSSVYLSSL